MDNTMNFSNCLSCKLMVLYSLVEKNSLNAVKSFMDPLTYFDRRRIVNKMSSLHSAILHFVCYRGYLDIVEYLVVECGADVNIVYRNEQVALTAAFIAVRKENFSLLKLLVKLGANLQWKNMYGENLLQFACKYTQIYPATYLYNIGASINGDRNIDLCSRSINYCLLSLMLGTRPNDTDSKRDSIFILAAENGNVAVMNILRKFGVDIHYRNRAGHDALSAAIWKEQRISCRYFLDNAVYSKLDVALAFEICGARMILYRLEYELGLKMWVKSIKLRLSVPRGMDAKLRFYYKHRIQPIKEFQEISDLQRLRGNNLACCEQAQLVTARILKRSK